MKRTLLAIVALIFIATPSLATVFVHETHPPYIEGAPCSVCHKEDAPSIQPALTVCQDCHEQSFIDQVKLPMTVTHGPTWALNHRSEAKGNAPQFECSECHEQEYCLECHKSGFADEQGSFGNNMINVHRSDFQVSHPIAARTDPQLCSSCHENSFCVECHEDFAPADLAIRSHRRGWSDITVTPVGPAHEQFVPSQCRACHPDSVLPSHDWSSQHAREARKNLATCQACHPEGEVCLQCHSARTGLRINPHPDDWDDIDGRLERASDGRTCRRCH